MAAVQEFVDHSRSGMAGEWKRFNVRFKKATRGLDRHAISEYVDAIYDDIAQLRDISPKLNRRAHCMILFGAFENAIANICKLIDHHKLVPKPLPNRLHMPDIRRYLSPSISKRAFGKAWEWMDTLRVIRNTFAHSAAKTEEKLDPQTNKPLAGSNWEKLTAFVRRNKKLIEVTRHREIVIRDGLIDRAFIEATDALAKFHKAAKKLYR
jgi:hypothetical protein